MKYFTLPELLDMLPATQAAACRSLLEDHNDVFVEAQGSTCKHQAWAGGYLDHVVETMNIAVELHNTMDTLRTLSFRLHEALLVLFFHDLEKPWKSTVDFESKGARASFRDAMLIAYGVELTVAQKNAMEFVEGEGDKYSKTMRMMGQLAAFCHMCDIASARLWHDHGREHVW